MPTDKNQYFIALIPPSPLVDQLLELKQYCLREFNTKAALNSPPHVTLHMPFYWKSSHEEKLAMQLEKFSNTASPMTIKLSGFGSFPPRVIYVKVESSVELTSCQERLKKFCRKELGLFNANHQDNPFNPHITIAFRDLRKEMFTKAWDEFQKKDFEGGFSADKISLMKYNGKVWEEFRNFKLLS